MESLLRGVHVAVVDDEGRNDGASARVEGGLRRQALLLSLLMFIFVSNGAISSTVHVVLIQAQDKNANR